MLAAAVFISTIVLLGWLGSLAWQILPEVTAPSLAPAPTLDIAGEVGTEAVDRPVAPADVLAAAERALPAQEPANEGGVRVIEGVGIAPARVEGPLERVESTVVVPVEPPRGPEPELLRLVTFEDAATVNARTSRIKLAHLEAPAADARCTTATGATWPCGMRARTAVQRFVRRRAIACLDVREPAEGSPRVANCTVADADIGRWLVEQGWATPVDGAPEGWAALHEAARAAGRGLHDPAGR